MEGTHLFRCIKPDKCMQGGSSCSYVLSPTVLLPSPNIHTQNSVVNLLLFCPLLWHILGIILSSLNATVDASYLAVLENWFSDMYFLLILSIFLISWGIGSSFTTRLCSLCSLKAQIIHNWAEVQKVSKTTPQTNQTNTHTYIFSYSCLEARPGKHKHPTASLCRRFF